MLTGTPIIRRTAISPNPQKVQQRVLNQSLLKNTYGSIVRVGNTTYVRKPPTTKRPKQMISSPSTRIIRSQHDTSAKNVYTYSRQVMQGGPRKIGSTTIRQAASLDMLAQQQKLSSATSSLIANRPAVPPGSITQTVRRVVQTTANVHSPTGVSPVKKDSLIRQHQEHQRKMVMAARTQKHIQHQPHIPTKPKAVINMPSLLGKSCFQVIYSFCVDLNTPIKHKM